MKYYLLTLGCPKNTVDSEGIAMMLSDAGYRGTAVPDDADVLIVNTCGFLQAAEDESLANLRELAKSKRRGQVLVAAGCMAQRNGNRIVQEVPGVDGLLGTRRWMEVVPFIKALREDKPGSFRQRSWRTKPGWSIPDTGTGAAASLTAFGRYALLGDSEHPLTETMPRPAVQNGSAYLKISDGCNAPCAFCSIPSFKGKLASRPMEAIVAEARALVSSGAEELILIAQDTTDYGRDLGRPDLLPDLMTAILDAVPDLQWLRLMYAYPGHVSQRLIDVMASDPRVCHYLDIPLQHGHPAILRRMFRPSKTDKVLETFAEMRRAMPDIAFRSTFIVGLPGETEEEFQGLLDFVQTIQFDKVGAFTFSPEPGTPAADMPGQVDEEIKGERHKRLMALQQRISLVRNQAQVGRTLDVLVEAHGKMEAMSPAGRHGHGAKANARRQPVSLARSYRDAPEVDGLVVIPGILPAGKMSIARITGAIEYDLVGEAVTA